MSYEQFVTNYRRQTHYARSLNEAYKTPEYCSAITIYKSQSNHTWEHLKELFALIILIGVVSAITFWALTA